ncbi:MAG: ABC transporter permease subunit, partial [Tissierellales bacterium]|nr:ABC transporter permease subunit [Tissierellales bacterium]
MTKYMGIVLRKELIDIMRDKKTLITSFLIPILIFPIMALAMGASVGEIVKDAEKPVPVVIKGDIDSDFGSYLQTSGGLDIRDLKNPLESLDELEIYAIIDIKPEFLEALSSGRTAKLEVLYDESSQKSSMGMSKITDIVSGFAETKRNERLKELGIDPEILEVINVDSVSVASDENSGITMMLVTMLVPMLLSIWAATGCIAPATDIGAGEKERQTLEPLLTTNVSRTSLLLGKYIAVVISGILATFASLIGFGLAAMINPSMFATISLSLGALLTIGFAAVGLTMAFAALELAISFYARNFKEAQTYLTPITFVVLIPAY